jgi:hypothetical protein
MALSKDELVIDDSTDDAVLFPPGFGRGQEPRDWDEFPPEMMASPDEMSLIPRGEWSDRIKDLVRTGSQLSDIRNRADNGKMFVNLDQGQNGYCWAFSTGHCVVIDRAKMNQPFVRLNPTAVGAIVKKGRNEGGWCGLSLKFLRDVGIPDEKYWPGQSRDLKYDTSEMRANAAMHRVTEDWYDLARQDWSQRMTFDQVATCLLNRVPCALDFDWWGHSVCGMDLVEIEPGDFGIRILNSWLNWGANGTGVLRGSKALPNGAVAIRSSRATVQ